MNEYAGQIQPAGPIVPIRVRPAGGGAEFPIDALLDTGSSGTLVQPGRLPSQFGPLPGRAIIGSAAAPLAVKRAFAVELRLDDPNFPWRPFRIGEYDLSFLGINFLLGRDFLDGCGFVYNDPKGRFKLSWQ